MSVAAKNAGLALVAFLAVLLVWRLAHVEGGVAAAVARGERPRAPAFTLGRLDGNGMVDLRAYRGRVVVVNFWASWCGPCADESAGFERSWHRWQQDVVTFVGVNARDAKSPARTFVRRYGLSFPIVHDGSDGTVRAYGVGAFPATFVVAPDGRVVAHMVGYVEEKQLDREIARALERGGG